MNNRQCAVGIAAGLIAIAVAVCPVQAQQQETLRVPVSVLERYVGDYDQNGTTVRVRLSGDTLFQEAPGQRLALVPISETVFRMGSSIFTAEFVIDQAGGVMQVLSDGGHVEYWLPRKGSRAAAPPPAPPGATVHVPRSVLEQYVGTYEYIPGQMNRTDLRVVVRLNGDTLTRWLAGTGEDVLTPISETQFRVGNTRMMVEFVVDEAGVTQILGSGFQQGLARLQPES